MTDEDDFPQSGPEVSRRRALQVAAAALMGSAAVVQSPTVSADPVPLRIDDDAALERALPALANWGRWGPADQLGTLNFITPRTRLAAATLIRNGRVVPLGREFSAATPGLREFSYEMRSYDDPLPEEAGALDVVGMTCHGFAVTHVDALCHMYTPAGEYGMYNGFSISEVTDAGAAKLGVEHIATAGIVGRGVLLDVAEVKGGPLPLGTAIMPEDLDAAAALHGLTVGEGDIVFVRTGAGALNTYRGASGLHASCLPWLRAHRVAVLSSDSDSDVHPAAPGFEKWSEPIHMVAIPYLGLTLLDQAELDALAAACAEEGRWEFFLTAAPWRMKGATGGAVTPLAMF
jgi:kynurenine formamidase